MLQRTQHYCSTAYYGEETPLLSVPRLATILYKKLCSATLIALKVGLFLPYQEPYLVAVSQVTITTTNAAVIEPTRCPTWRNRWAKADFDPVIAIGNGGAD